MSRYDDTIEQLKKKNNVLRNHLTDLINEEDNTEIDILKQVMMPHRSTEEPLNTSKVSIKPNQEWRNEPEIKGTTKDDLHDLFNQAYKSDDVSMTTKRTHREYFNKFKENINEIKNTDYQLPLRQKDSNINDKLREIQLNDQHDKLELKKKENLLLNKLNEKDEMISVLQNKVKALQQENRELVDNSHEYKYQLEIEREQNKNLRKLEIDSKLASNDEILNLKPKLHELSEKNKALLKQNQDSDLEIEKSQTIIKDLTIKLIMYKKSNNSANEKMDRLRLIKSLLTSTIQKETSTRDDTESLLDSTTIRLINQSPNGDFFTQNTNFSACDAKSKFRILIKMVMFIIRVQKLCKNEVKFKSQIIQLLNND